MTRNDLITLLPDKYVMAEIGVDRGEFFDSYYSEDNEYKLIDLWELSHDKYYSKEHHKESGRIMKGKVKELANVEMMTMDSIEASKMFSDRYFDFVYIDADHSYKSVKADIEAWLPKVKQGGIIAGHDYDPSPDYAIKFDFGVEQAVEESFKDFNLTDETHFKSWWVKV